jgi:hypothetical protein
MNDLYASLDVMWKGMAGLFVICSFIAVLVILFKKIVMKKQKT